MELYYRIIKNVCKTYIKRINSVCKFLIGQLKLFVYLFFYCKLILTMSSSDKEIVAICFCMELLFIESISINMKNCISFGITVY